MKIYIAGKVTNEPVMACIEKFQKAKAYIESLGHQAVIPFEIPGMVFGISHKEAMKLCRPWVANCDAIFLLRDAWNSKGALEECELAEDIGNVILYQKDQSLKWSADTLKSEDLRSSTAIVNQNSEIKK